MRRIKKKSIALTSALSLATVSIFGTSPAGAIIISGLDDNGNLERRAEITLRNEFRNEPDNKVANVDTIGEQIYFEFWAGIRSNLPAEGAPTNITIEACLPANILIRGSYLGEAVRVKGDNLPADARLSCGENKIFVRGYNEILTVKAIAMDLFGLTETHQVKAIAYDRDSSPEVYTTSDSTVNIDITKRDIREGVSTSTYPDIEDMLIDNITIEDNEYDNVSWNVDNLVVGDLNQGARTFVDIGTQDYIDDNGGSSEIISVDKEWVKGQGNADDINIYYTIDPDPNFYSSSAIDPDDPDGIVWCDSVDSTIGQIVYPSTLAGSPCPTGKVTAVMIEHLPPLSDGDKYSVNLELKPVGFEGEEEYPVSSHSRAMGSSRSGPREWSTPASIVGSYLKVSYFSDGNDDGKFDIPQIPSQPIGDFTMRLTGMDDDGNQVDRILADSNSWSFDFDPGPLKSGNYTLISGFPSDCCIDFSSVSSNNIGGWRGNNFNPDGTLGFRIEKGESLQPYLGIVPILDPGEPEHFIGDTVWEDIDKDGHQDENEPGIGGIEVNLTGQDTAGTPVNMSTTTADNGFYSFMVKDGTYDIIPSLDQNRYSRFSKKFNHVGVTQDSNVGAGEPFQVAFDYTSKKPMESVDIGLIPHANSVIGNTVWHDINKNGIQDEGEPGIENVEVNLNGEDLGGEQVSLNTLTGPDGKYLFENLYAGNYDVTVILPEGFSGFTKPYAVSNEDLDSNSNYSGESEVFILNNSIADNVDVGLIIEEDTPTNPGIKGVAWDDKNSNGIREDGEKMTGEVRVVLRGATDSNRGLELSTFTNYDGNYHFEDVSPGEYDVKFNPPPASIGLYTGFTEKEAGLDANIDSDVNERGELSIILENEDVEVDAGFTPVNSEPVRVTISGNAVWDDTNENGIFDDEESPLGDISVTLTGTDVDGNDVSLTTKTNADGSYSFKDVRPGNYIVKFTMPDGYERYSPQDIGNDDTKDSDVNEQGVVSITVTADSDNTNIGSGFIKKKSDPEPTPTDPEPTPTEPEPTPTEPEPTPTETTPTEPTPTDEPTPTPTATDEPTSTPAPTKTEVVVPPAVTKTVTPKPSPNVTTTVTEVLSEKEVRYGEPSKPVKTEAEIDTGEINSDRSYEVVPVGLTLMLLGGLVLLGRRRENSMN